MEGREEKDFIAILREHGLQVTYQRLAIYQILYYSKEHPSAESVYQQVRKRFPMISLGTVYKALEKFHEVGLLQKVSHVTDVTRYDATLTPPHHHLVCVKCQKIQDYHDSSLTEEATPAEKNGFKIIGQQVLFHGYCPSCLGTMV
jgi:Fur family transcriptional regulator, peroxide stress response regulator